MTLAAGSRLGPYEILAPLGAGGMGEVYRARDPRLGREVALKVLPGEVTRDPDRLSRFEQEARAASALNHPNIITIYEVGLSDTTPFIAMELVDGKTLRELSASGPMPVRRVIDIAAQVAEGLAKAHGAGIVHRDLKPENVMVSKDGYVKILDFGLAKLAEPESGQVSAMLTLARPETHPGTVLGTVGYMSPEQASGQPLDFRSDQFSFGSILYEVAAGQKPFARKTAAETMSAIIREEPEPLAKLRSDIPPPLRWIVERCMTKDPEERYASTRDLARDLESVRDHISEVTSAAETPLARPGRGRRRVSPVLAGATLLAIGLGAGWAARAISRRVVASTPSFHRVTFRRGILANARFATDGQTILYGANWEGEPSRVYLTRPESPESRPFDFGPGDFDILAVSPLGELAILALKKGPAGTGTLARVPLAGGIPREAIEGVTYAGADWAPDGKELAVTRLAGDRTRLEFPPGRVLRESTDYLAVPRFSPGGDRIAFTESGESGAVMVIDLAGGKAKALSSGWRNLAGVPCWRPDGREVWFTAVGPDKVLALFAVTLSGEQRLVTRVPGDLELDDISRDGRVLLAHHAILSVMRGLAAGQEKERDLAWLDGSVPADLSADGKTLLFSETREGGGASSSVYLRKTDGSAAVRLGDGSALALSPDGKWVLALQSAKGLTNRLVVLPTGPGATKLVKTGSLRGFGGAAWSPDSRRVVFSATEAGRPGRLFVCEIEAAAPRVVSPEGFGIQTVGAISPDGRYVIGTEGPGKASLFPLEKGEVRPVSGLEAEERPIQWSADGLSLYVHKGSDVLGKVWLLELSTAKRRLFREIRPAEPAHKLEALLLTRDGKSYVYSASPTLSELFVVEGLR